MTVGSLTMVVLQIFLQLQCLQFGGENNTLGTRRVKIARCKPHPSKKVFNRVTSKRHFASLLRLKKILRTRPLVLVTH